MRRPAAVLILLALLAVPAFHASAGKGRLRHGTVGIVVVPPQPQPTPDCPPAGANTSLIRYVAPGASGSGLTVGTPMSMSAALSAATSGYTIVAASGTYTAGNGGLLVAPSGRTGVTVCAADESNPPLLDAGFNNWAISLISNSGWVIQGFNAKRGNATIIRLESSTNNTFKRIVAWDSRHGWNDSGIHVQNGSNNNLFEDIAVFGVNRYGIINIGNVSGNTFRRVWVRWEGQTNVGPKAAFQASYPDSGVSGNVFENIIGTWDPVSMPSNYILQDQGANYPINAGALPNGCTFSGSQTTCTNFGVQNRQGVLSEFAELSAGAGNQRWWGSLAYLRTGDPIGSPSTDSLPLVMFQRSGNSTETRHVFAAVPNFSGANTIFGWGGGFTEGTGTADRITTMIQGGNNFGSWTVTNHVTGTTLASINSQNANPFTGSSSSGARLCFRYQNQTLTSTPLWPWPMDDRIAQAVNTLAGAYNGPCNTCSGTMPRTRAGTIVNVTTDVENLLGPIPPQCRN